jgi:hypothetical protein
MRSWRELPKASDLQINYSKYVDKSDNSRADHRSEQAFVTFVTALSQNVSRIALEHWLTSDEWQADQGWVTDHLRRSGEQQYGRTWRSKDDPTPTRKRGDTGIGPTGSGSRRLVLQTGGKRCPVEATRAGPACRSAEVMAYLD